MDVLTVTNIGKLETNFIWDFRKLPFSLHLGKYILKIGKVLKFMKLGK